MFPQPHAALQTSGCGQIKPFMIIQIVSRGLKIVCHYYYCLKENLPDSS